MPPSGCSSRKLVQPFVRQYRRVACERRRMRRLAASRPAMDDWYVLVSNSGSWVPSRSRLPAVWAGPAILVPVAGWAIGRCSVPGRGSESGRSSESVDAQTCGPSSAVYLTPSSMDASLRRCQMVRLQRAPAQGPNGPIRAPEGHVAAPDSGLITDPQSVIGCRNARVWQDSAAKTRSHRFPHGFQIGREEGAPRAIGHIPEPARDQIEQEA